eukprot:gene3140-3608_t
MTVDESRQALLSKEEGNTHFKQGNYDQAIECYSKAIKLCPSVNINDLAVFYKNRAACHFKLQNYKKSSEDATKSLEFVKNDAKALFRRAQAYEQLGQMEEAFKDIKMAYNIEPKNSAVQDVMRRLTVTLQQKVSKTQTTEGMVGEMIKAITSAETDVEKRKQAIKNLTILAHQSAGCAIMHNQKVLEKLKPLIFGENSEEVVSFLKMMHGLCKNSYQRSLEMMKLMPVHELKISLGKFTGDLDVVSNLLSVVIEVIMSMIYEARRVYPLTDEDAEKWTKRNQNNLDIRAWLEGVNEYGDLMLSLVGNLTNPYLTADARDCVVDTLIKLAPLHKAISDFILSKHGVECLLQVAACCGTLKAKGKPELAVTETTYTHVSVALSNIFNSIHEIEKDRLEFNKQADTVISKYFSECRDSENVKGLAALTATLEGSRETAESIVGNDVVLTRVLNMAQSDDIEMKVLAGEVLAYAAGLKKLCVTLREKGMGTFKMLFKSDDDRLKVRGLVGMCKIGMTGGGNIHEKHISDDGLANLYKTCIAFLVSDEKDFEYKKFAVEALAFLTMDADLKEEFIADKQALNTLLDVAKSGDNTTLYGVCNTFVNLTNSYDKPEKNKEMEDLAKYAQHKVPTFGEKDEPEYLKKRIATLVNAGITSALVSLVANTTSDVTRETIARIFHAIVEEQEHRGSVVQQGGGKSLIPLSLNGTVKGKDLATQAIAKIGITTNPTLAFPGQRCLEVVRPLIQLLGPTKSGLQQFEALMALTNLAQVSDYVRRRILKERGIIAIETHMFEEHDLLRQAATECMCNLTMCEDVLELYLDENSTTERLKLLVLFSGEVDQPKLVRAATGALAILSANEKICEKIMQVQSSNDILQQILVSDSIEVQHRAVCIIANIMENCRDIAERFIEGDWFEILLALSQCKEDDRKSIAEHANRALEAARSWGFIKENK